MNHFNIFNYLSTNNRLESLYFLFESLHKLLPLPDRLSGFFFFLVLHCCIYTTAAGIVTQQKDEEP